MSTNQRIGTNVRIIAKARGMSLRAIAKAMKFNNEQVLFTRLSGKSKITAEEVARLAQILEVEVAVLFSDPDDLVGRTSGWWSVTADQTAQAA